MLSERFQILLEPRQRQALDRESKRTGRPIGELIREAIDARFDADREARIAAFEEVSRMRAEIRLSPEEIERMIQSEHDI
jgi:predicted DNA-binding protein